MQFLIHKRAVQHYIYLPNKIHIHPVVLLLVLASGIVSANIEMGNRRFLGSSAGSESGGGGGLRGSGLGVGGTLNDVGSIGVTRAGGLLGGAGVASAGGGN
ncbi:acanthoscurrin-1-like [Capsicum galapagoense]